MDRNYINYGRGNNYSVRYTSKRSRRVYGMLGVSKKTLEKMANQFIAAAVIALILILLSNIEGGFCGKIIDGARWVVNENYDFKTAVYGAIDGFKAEINKLKATPVSTVPVSSEATFGRTEAAFASASVMIMPLDGQITSGFGEREKPSDPATQETHNGTDIAGEEGAPIKAAMDGVVEKIEENDLIGRSVRIKHDGGIETLYGHCSEILVDENQTVKQGDIIAKVGHTGNATAPHLHFEVIKDGEHVDPLSVIGSINENR